MERRARHTILFNIDAVLESVGGADLAGSVDRGSLAAVALFGNGEGCHGGWLCLLHYKFVLVSRTSNDDGVMKIGSMANK